MEVNEGQITEQGAQSPAPEAPPQVEQAPAPEPTPAPAPAPAPAPQPKPEAKEDPFTKPLTKDNWKERVALAKERNKKAKAEEKAAAEGREQAPEAQKPSEKAPKEPPKQAPEAAEETPPPAASDFKPTGKFRALGKEYELPKHLLEAIKTPEQERELLDVYSKAHGLDHIKQRHTELYEQHRATVEEHNALVGDIDEIKGIYSQALKQRNPLLMADFFEALQIPVEHVLQFADAVKQYGELDPTVRSQVDQSLSAQRENRSLSKQSQGALSQAQAASAQAMGMHLNAVLARPDVAQAIKLFSERTGQSPDQFREHVINTGSLAWFQEQKNLPVEEAVNRTIKMLGLTPAPAPQAQPAQTPAPAAPAPAPQAQVQAAPTAPAPHRAVPTIPGVSGKSTSPTKTKIRTLEDLRARAKAVAQG